MPPEPPPEGVLIESARREAGLSVREAARRAGISEGWWRQVVKGFQNLSGGAFGAVRDVPADTVAKMAGAVNVTPEQMETAGERPDAAGAMRQQAVSRPAGAAALRKPPGLPFVTPEMEALMAPYLAEVEIAVEVARRRHPGEHLTGAKVFPGSPADADSWDRLAAGGREPGAVAWRLAAVLAWEAEMAQGKGKDDANRAGLAALEDQ